MTTPPPYEYLERIAICEDGGATPERAEEIARQQLEDEEAQG